MSNAIPSLPANASTIAQEWHGQVTAEHNATAAFKIALCHLDASMSVKHNIPIDKTKAFLWIKYAAKGGHVHATTMLASCYLFGGGVVKDERTALGYYKVAAERNDPEALNALGWYYEYGSLDASTPKKEVQDLIEALKYYKDAMNFGSKSGKINYEWLANK